MAQRPVRLKPDTITKIRQYRRALNRSKLSGIKLIMFGSQAMGTAHADSDIDVAVVSPAFGKSYHDERVWLMRQRQPDELFDIEPHPFHPDDLEDRWDTIAQEVKRHGIELDDNI